MPLENEYADLTYNTKNPLARFSHRKRLKVGTEIVLTENCKTLLDFGAGDGKFLEDLSKENHKIKLTAYEPVMELKATPSITVQKELDTNLSYDTITCFEVLEHFNAEEQLQILKDIHTILENNGFLIISVPIEIGFASVVKNIRRLGLSFNKKNFTTIKECFMGIEPPLLRQQKGYIFSHIGFNHHQLELLFSPLFEIKEKINSPFKYLPESVNSQVFYKLQKVN